MPDGHRYELIDGKLVERNMGAESSAIAANFIRITGNYSHAEKAGKVFATDCGYQIFPNDPGRVRFADGSFVGRDRLPGDKAPSGHMRIAPDLALEVVSPNDTAKEVEAKRLEWLPEGTRLLWIAYPATRTVHVFPQAGAPVVLGENDELGGGDVLPGFKCHVADLFEGV